MGKLWECAKRGYAGAVAELLDAGADPNDPDQAQQPVRQSAVIESALAPSLLVAYRGEWLSRQGAARCIWPRRATLPTL